MDQKNKQGREHFNEIFGLAFRNIIMKNCPECKSSNVRRSRRKPSSRSVEKMFSYWIRCLECGARFLAIDWSLIAWWITTASISLTVAGFIIHTNFNSPGKKKIGPTAASPIDLNFDNNDKPFPLVKREIVKSATVETPENQYAFGLSLLKDFLEKGNSSSLNEALKFLKNAANRKNARAQATLGALYEKGCGVIQDYTEAIRWYRQAAEQGEAEAMLRLGLMMQGGKGAPQDLVEAYIWLNLAAARGDRRAEDSRDSVGKLMPLGKIHSAQNSCRNLDKKIPRLDQPTASLPFNL